MSHVVHLSTSSNPLRNPLDQRLPRVAGPCAMVLFGVTGDLSRKKVMPAIYDLYNRGLLPPRFALVGFARRDFEGQDFATILHDSVRDNSRTPFNEDTWAQLSAGIRYVQGDLADAEAYNRLAATVKELDAERGTGGNHAFYLSIPPGLFPVVLQHLRGAGLAAGTSD